MAIEKISEVATCLKRTTFAYRFSKSNVSRRKTHIGWVFTRKEYLPVLQRYMWKNQTKRLNWLGDIGIEWGTSNKCELFCEKEIIQTFRPTFAGRKYFPPGKEKVKKWYRWAQKLFSVDQTKYASQEVHLSPKKTKITRMIAQFQKKSADRTMLEKMILETFGLILMQNPNSDCLLRTQGSTRSWKNTFKPRSAE